MNDDTIPAKNQPVTGHALLRHIPPKPFPQSGSGWPDSGDYPGIEASLYIPRDSAREFSSDYVVLGERLCGPWGQPDGEYQRTSHTFRSATLAEAEEKAEAWLADGCRVLSMAIDARASRLARREANIANAYAKYNRVRPPQ